MAPRNGIINTMLVTIAIGMIMMSTLVNGSDPCAQFGGGCDGCVSHSGCGWCSWGQGYCVTGHELGPSAGICHESSKTSSNWYFGTCSDQCYLVCGITCSNSQDCSINRLVDPPECTCVTKQGVVIGAVVGSIFIFCLLLTIFVWVRRRNALKYSRMMMKQEAEDDNNRDASISLPGGQPLHVIAYTQAYVPPEPKMHGGLQ